MQATEAVAAFASPICIHRGMERQRVRRARESKKRVGKKKRKKEEPVDLSDDQAGPEKHEDYLCGHPTIVHICMPPLVTAAARFM
jgi:hypothetical protein